MGTLSFQAGGLLPRCSLSVKFLLPKCFLARCLDSGCLGFSRRLACGLGALGLESGSFYTCCFRPQSVLPRSFCALRFKAGGFLARDFSTGRFGAQGFLS
ncbi:MAG: hypothetical protein WCK83_09465, partial [Burkholderiales bacterium]